jgi:Methylmalonyl Co-A mutase-associated GTPase MeaB
LLCEALPGERIRLNSYVQRQPLYTIAGGMPAATVELGDRGDAEAGWIGPYIGETPGRARSIVHSGPLLAAARNRPAAIAITGEPGGGKTTLALLLICQLAVRGVTVAAVLFASSDRKVTAGEMMGSCDLTRTTSRRCRRKATTRPASAGVRTP